MVDMNRKKRTYNNLLCFPALALGDAFSTALAKWVSPSASQKVGRCLVRFQDTGNL